MYSKEIYIKAIKLRVVDKYSFSKIERTLKEKKYWSYKTNNSRMV